MLNPDRIFAYKDIDSEDDLVEVMTKHNWPLCYGFYYGGLLYLNDGDKENDPEYSMVVIDKRVGHSGIEGREVGRARPRSMDETLLMKLIQDMTAGKFSSEDPVRAEVEPKWHHSCQLCRLDED